MKLRNFSKIYEEQARSQLTEQQMIEELKRLFIITPNSQTNKDKEIDIRITAVKLDNKRYSIYNDLESITTIEKMPFKIDTVVGGLTLSGFEKLDTLPSTISRLTLRQSPITNFAKIKSNLFSINLKDCLNLISLDELEPYNFLAGGRSPIKVIIENCPNLKIDPYVCREKLNIHFVGKLPRNVNLISSTLFLNGNLVQYINTLEPELQKIIEKYQGAGPGKIFDMYRELINAGYKHHAEFI